MMLPDAFLGRGILLLSMRCWALLSIHMRDRRRGTGKRAFPAVREAMPAGKGCGAAMALVMREGPRHLGLQERLLLGGGQSSHRRGSGGGLCGLHVEVQDGHARPYRRSGRIGQLVIRGDHDGDPVRDARRGHPARGAHGYGRLWRRRRGLLRFCRTSEHAYVHHDMQWVNRKAQVAHTCMHTPSELLSHAAVAALEDRDRKLRMCSAFPKPERKKNTTEPPMQQLEEEGNGWERKKGTELEI